MVLTLTAVLRRGVVGVVSRIVLFAEGLEMRQRRVRQKTRTTMITLRDRL